MEYYIAEEISEPQLYTATWLILENVLQEYANMYGTIFIELKTKNFIYRYM